MAESMTEAEDRRALLRGGRRYICAYGCARAWATLTFTGATGAGVLGAPPSGFDPHLTFDVTFIAISVLLVLLFRRLVPLNENRTVKAVSFGCMVAASLLCVLAAWVPGAALGLTVAGSLAAGVGYGLFLLLAAEVLATFSLLSNLCVAVLSPLIFSFIGEHVSMPFGHSFGIICRQMIPLLILPFVLAMLLRRFLPRVHHEIKKRQELSFYMWSVALATVTGNTVSFLMRQDASNYRIETIMALLALVVCGLQFITGRRIGRRFRDKVAGAQGLGQKNTILAIWMAQTYLNPVSSVAPAFYVVWQNIVNSYQLWLRRRDKG